jgi:hypothetical protein
MFFPSPHDEGSILTTNLLSKEHNFLDETGHAVPTLCVVPAAYVTEARALRARVMAERFILEDFVGLCFPGEL